MCSISHSTHNIIIWRKFMERIYTTQEQTWSKTVQCTGTTNSETASCGHLWKVSEHDLVVQQLWEMFDLECVAIGFICPDCGTFTEIPSSTIPTIIANRCYANYRNKKFIRRRHRRRFACRNKLHP